MTVSRVGFSSTSCAIREYRSIESFEYTTNEKLNRCLIDVVLADSFIVDVVESELHFFVAILPENIVGVQLKPWIEENRDTLIEHFHCFVGALRSFFRIQRTSSNHYLSHSFDRSIDRNKQSCQIIRNYNSGIRSAG